MRPIPQAAIDIVKRFEGLRLTSYPDPASGGAPWTVGYGSVKGVTPGMTITQADADTRLELDLETAANRLQAVIGNVLSALSDSQYAALLDFVFNVGAAPGWTIWRVINARQFDRVPAELNRFVYAAGRIVPGLVTRRRAEGALWASSVPQKANVPVIGTTVPAAAILAPAVIVAAHAHSPLLPIIAGLSLAGVVIWLCFTFLKPRTPKMAVSSDVQPIVDALNALPAEIAAALTAASSSGSAALQAQLTAEQQAHADDVAALTAALNAAKAAIPAPPAA